MSVQGDIMLGFRQFFSFPRNLLTYNASKIVNIGLSELSLTYFLPLYTTNFLGIAWYGAVKCFVRNANLLNL